MDALIRALHCGSYVQPLDEGSPIHGYPFFDMFKGKPYIMGVTAEFIRKQHEGRPNIADGITNGEIQLVINTPVGKLSVTDDSYIRKAAIKYRVPYITTLTAALAAAEGIAARRKGRGQVKALQQYHKDVS